jgi:glycosyltransferase involved in cell wall biosynthesis
MLAADQGAARRSSGTARRALRILKVMPFFSWPFGGSVAQARLVCRELSRRGHEVRVLTTDLGAEPDAPREAWTVDPGDGYGVFRARAGALHAVPPYLPPRRLRAALAAEVARADIVCANVGLTLTSLAVARACARAGVPWVYNAEGSLSPARLRQKRWRKALFLRVCERSVLRGATAVQALTEGDASDLRALGTLPERIVVIGNGIDPERWTGGDRAAVRARWKVDEATTVILFLGRLAPEKGLDVMLDAAAPLLLGRADRRLVLAGPDGGVAAALERRARELGVAGSVHLPGPIPPELCRDALAAADVFAHTSRSEGVPIGVLEAAAAGLPLWVTDRCNVPEVAHYDAGTVDPLDAPRLRASLLAMLLDVDRRRRCADNARRMVRERFALPAVVDRLESLYRELAA